MALPTKQRNAAVPCDVSVSTSGIDRPSTSTARDTLPLAPSPSHNGRSPTARTTGQEIPRVGLRQCTCKPRPTWFQLIAGNHDSRRRPPVKEQSVKLHKGDWKNISPGTAEKLQRMWARFQGGEPAKSDTDVTWRIQLVYLVNAMFVVGIVMVVYVVGTWGTESSVLVTTPRGRYRGVSLAVGTQNVFYFSGIRFGKPACSRFRFGAPVASASMDSLVIDVAPACPQLTENTFEQLDTAEDCLHLNIWTPLLPIYCKAGCELREVVVFLTGRDFSYGANTAHDGRYLSLYGDLVLVVPNYRLGPLGFLNANLSDSPGNVGLYDQRVAFKWISENIDSFGGNASKVAVIGHDAGAVSLGYQLLSPEPHDLQDMKRFVLHSSSPLRRFPDNSGKENFIHLARILQCNAVHDANKVDCLREKSVESLLQASEAIQATSPVFVPSFGTHLLPSTELLSLPSRISGKQFLLVNVRDEGSYFLQLLVQRLRHGNYVNTEAVHRYILQLLAILGIGDHAQSIRAMYANVTSDSELGVWCSILGDVLFVCPMQYLAKYLVAAGNSVKVMVFGQRPSWKDTTTSGYGDDLSFLFGIPLLPSGSGTSDEREFSVTVIKYWSTFVKTGTLPKLINGEQWPDLRSTSPLATVELKMDGARLLEPPFRTKQCDALQHILLQPRG